MDVDLGRLEVGVIVVVPLAGQQHVHAVIHVGADDGGQFQIIIGSGQSLFFVKHVDQTIFIHHGRLFALLLGQGDRHADKVNVVMLPIGVVRAQAPTTLFARHRRFGGPLTVCILVNRLQPWRTTVVRRERHALTEVRLEQRPGHFSRRWIEQDRRSGAVIPLHRPWILRVLGRALPLTAGDVAVPLPVPHRRVIGHDLALFIVGVARLTLSRHEHFHPILNAHDHRIGLPVRLLALVDDLEGLAKPVDRGADQLIRRDTLPHPTLAIRQFLQVRHRVGVRIADLQRIVEPAVPPHARHIVVSHVAVIEEFAGQVLTATAAAFRLQVQGFRRTDDFDVHPIRLRPDHRVLHRTILAGRPEIVRLGAGAALPTDGPAVRMVGVEHFGPAVNHTPLHRLPEVTTSNRGGRVTEGVGAIGQRFIFESEILMLQMHLIDAERLTAIVQRSTARTIGIRQRVALRQEVALLVQWTEGFVADFVIKQHELAEVRSRPVIDVDLPTALHFLVRPAAYGVEVLRALRLDDEGPEETQDGQLAVMAPRVELTHTFLHVRMDIPLEILDFAR